jgi:hypothetical protein
MFIDCIASWPNRQAAPPLLTDPTELRAAKTPPPRPTAASTPVLFALRVTVPGVGVPKIGWLLHLSRCPRASEDHHGTNLPRLPLRWSSCCETAAWRTTGATTTTLPALVRAISVRTGSNYSQVTLRQSNFADPSNLEVVAESADTLKFFWRDSGPSFSWSGPYLIETGA